MTSEPRPVDPLPASGTDASTSAWDSPTAATPPPSPASAAHDPFDRRGPASPVPAAAVRSRGGAFLNLLLGIAFVVAIGGVAFAAGRATAPPATSANGRGAFGGNGPGFAPNASGAPGGLGNAFGGAGAAISIQGTVTAVSADSISLQLASGQTVTIPTNSATTYRQSQPATAGAVTSGNTVVIQLEGAGRGVFNGGNGNGGQGAPGASGAPGRAFGTAATVTVIPAGS